MIAINYKYCLLLVLVVLLLIVVNKLFVWNVKLYFQKETLLVSQFTIALPLYSVGGEWSPPFLPKTTPTHPQSPPALVKQQLMTVP